MNKSYKIIAMLMCVMSIFSTSCDDSVEYDAAKPEGSEFYFSKDQKNTLELSNKSGSLYLTVYRADKTYAQTVTVTTVMPDSIKDNIDIPETLTFRAGSANENLRVKYTNIEDGVEYKFTVTLDSENPYANSSVEFKLIKPKAVVYEWEVVTDSAYLLDNMFAVNGVMNAGIMGLTVEKAKGHDIYRLQSPYDNEYMKALFGNTYANFFPADYEFPYIILDGESYAEDGWYIPTVKLGFKSVLGSFPVRDDDYETFGSVAVNLSNGGEDIPSDSKEFPLGKYNSKLKCFDFGVVFHQIDGYGYFPYNSGSFMLYLDQSLMSSDINRDYTWEDRPELTSFYTTTLSEGGWEQAIQQTKEDPTLYRFVEPYAEGANIAFYFNKETGYISLVKGQASGLTTNFGNTVYIEQTPGVSKYDAANETLTLGYTFYITDANGNKTAELYTSVETILWGHATEIDQLMPGTSVDDFVGSWDSYGQNLSTGALDTVTVTIAKKDAQTVKIAGLANIDNYNDEVTATYDKRTGFLKLKPQAAPSLDGGTTIFYPYLTFLNSMTGAYTMSESEELICGITKNGKIKLVNAATNSSRYDVMGYVAKTSDGYLFVGDQKGARYATFTWDKAEVKEDEGENESTVSSYVNEMKKVASLYSLPVKLTKQAAKPRFANPFAKMTSAQIKNSGFKTYGTTVKNSVELPFRLEAGINE